jgi:hypothetical protein
MICNNSRRISLALQRSAKKSHARSLHNSIARQLIWSHPLCRGIGQSYCGIPSSSPSSSFTSYNSNSTWRRTIATQQDESSTTPSPPTESPETETNSAHPASSTTAKRKGKPTSQIQLVQLQGLHTKEAIRDHFLPLIKREDSTSLKWMTTLKNQMTNKPKRSAKAKGTQTNYLSHTQTYLQKQPKELKSAFWDLVLVVTNESKKKKKDRRLTPPKDHVKLLQKVRQSAVDFPLMWSQNRKRKMNKQNQLLETSGKKSYPWTKYLAERSETLASIHAAKSEEELVEDATRLTEILHDSLPTRNYERLISTFENHLHACNQDRKLQNGGAKISPERRKRRIQILFSNIRAPTQIYIHLVAPDLADFLYMTIEDDGTNTRNDVVSDPRISDSQKAFDATLEKFIDSFAAVHGILWKEFQSNKKEQQETQELPESELDNSDDSVEAVLESFHDAVAGHDESTASKGKKDVISMKPRKYVLFEAISLKDFPEATEERATILPSTAPDLPNFPSKSPDGRLVMIDNLPIDINENSLMDAYSRCGPIESLCVFNRRAHLDPGRRSADSRKKIRNPASFRQQWQRRRTPLYAMILFGDAQSAAKASVDPLRIFGMVLDRHLIRSSPSKDMTRLYLEDISGKNDTTAIEFQLSQILHPELYVCLDIDGDQRPSPRKQRQDANSSSCIIQFPDFEAAYWSYLKLSAELELIQEGDCALQWMETPRDAMLYWTRKLNF